MHPSWIVLIPPFAVLLASFITKKILPSLLLGIVLAASISSNFNPLQSTKKITTVLVEQLTTPDTLYIFLFLLSLGALISLITITGGTQAYANLIRNKIKTARGAESATALLSLVLLFDDFFSSITVGSIMKPITDTYSVARVKLAFLIDSMAAPVVILMPISSWIATLTMQLSKAGISTNLANNPLVVGEPYWIYLNVIPYIFYSLFLIVSVFFIISLQLSFGPMKRHELIAQKTKDLFGGKKPVNSVIETLPARKGSLNDFLIPITMLLFSIVVTLLYSGNYTFFHGNNGFLQALHHANIFYSLFLGSSVTLILCILYFLMRKKININTILTLYTSSWNLMGDSIAILFCSWAFSSLLLNDLHSGTYLAHLLVGNISINFLPCIFFIASAVTSIGIGSSWGTIAILVPLAVPMLLSFTSLPIPTTPEALPLLFPLLGAIFAGAVAGDHVSPLSSTTIMSALSSGTHLEDHISTQTIYALPAFVASIIAYLIVGFLAYSNRIACLLISIGIGALICIIILIHAHYSSKLKHK